jgi:uncharacterized protein YacL
VGQRTFHNRSNAPSNTSSDLVDTGGGSKAITGRRFLGQTWDYWAMRLALIGATCILCYNLDPFGIHGLPAAGLGFLVAMVILLAELRLRRAEISGLVGGACGAVLGLLAALLISLVISRTAEPEPTKSFLEPTQTMPPMKPLETSALIDGRIADICETHFLDGPLGLPRFVLLELQRVADSPEALKRQRGRRGLEVLERMQKMSWLDLRVLDQDFPGTMAVDQKLVELARGSGSKIVTNDFNFE